jgi:hypothetical protein
MPKTSSTGIEPRKIFGFVAFIFVIPSPKLTTFISAPFFYHAYFPGYRIVYIFTETRTEERFSGL